MPRTGRPPIPMPVGSRYGNLVIVKMIRIVGRNEYHCQCDCGNTVNVLPGNLRKGNTNSCGCLHRERAATLKYKHGGRKSIEYGTWQSMIQRCCNPKNSHYKYYGAKGVKIHPTWRHDFLAFLRDVGKRPSRRHTLDRYPNRKGNYEPGNVRWATQKEQVLNCDRVKLFDYKGERLSLVDIGKKTGIPYTTLRYRILTRGLSVEEATTCD